MPPLGSMLPIRCVQTHLSPLRRGQRESWNFFLPLQAIEARRATAAALARQWFGVFMQPRAPADGWLLAGLAEPGEDCLATSAPGRRGLEVMSPVDLEAELGMPGGHIFHGDLSWPWPQDDAPVQSAAQAWGVDTGHPGMLVCGSGAVRGGAVRGLGGHNAAMAVLSDSHR